MKKNYTIPAIWLTRINAACILSASEVVVTFGDDYTSNAYSRRFTNADLDNEDLDNEDLDLF